MCSLSGAPSWHYPMPLTLCSAHRSCSEILGTQLMAERVILLLYPLTCSPISPKCLPAADLFPGMHFSIARSQQVGSCGASQAHPPTSAAAVSIA